MVHRPWPAPACVACGACAGHNTARPPAPAARARPDARPDAREGLAPWPKSSSASRHPTRGRASRRLDRSCLLPAGRRGWGRRRFGDCLPRGFCATAACYARARCPGLCERDGARRLPCDGAMRMARGRRGIWGCAPLGPPPSPALRERVGTGRMPGDAPGTASAWAPTPASSNDVLGASAAGGITAGTARRAGGRPGWLPPPLLPPLPPAGPAAGADARRRRQAARRCLLYYRRRRRVRPTALGAGGTMQL